MAKYAIKGGKLVDGTGASPVEDSLVLVDDKKITYAGEATEIPEGYEIIDATGKTVMPGIIDTHIHFSGNLTDNDNDWVIETVAQKRHALSSRPTTPSPTASRRSARSAATASLSVTSSTWAS